METDLGNARQQVLNELGDRARTLGAVAVVGIRIDMENVGGALLSLLSGTRRRR